MRARACADGRARLAAAMLALAALGADFSPWTALASAVVEVAQKGRAFAVDEVRLTTGSTLRFTNEDDFPHQVHVTGTDMDVDSPLQGPGQVTEVTFPNAGTFEVRCGIHPRMRMTVRVQ